MNNSDQSNQEKVFFENLDAFRFFCFLSVFFYHSFHTNIPEIHSNEIYRFVTRFVFQNGNLGVNFFFVISGFLITYLLIQEKTKFGQINLPNFWMRRILRIWPLYYTCVAFGFLIFPILKTAFGQVPNETASLPHYLLFWSNFDLLRNGLPDSSMLSVLWSIAIEEQFYLVWPVILFLLPIRLHWIAFAAVLLISWIHRSQYLGIWSHELHTLSCIGDMAIGALGAWLVLTKANILQYLKQLSSVKIFLIYLIFIVFYLFRKELLRSNDILVIFERSIIAVVILLMILEQCYSKNSLFKLKNLHLFSKLGVISYGLYCLHFLGILITTTLTNLLGWNQKLWQVLLLETTVALSITIIISSISYRYFERRFLKLKERFTSVHTGHS